ncbi:MAG: hypothetical protein ACOY3K_00185 [Candidatus Omnitrophota bacterium]
MKRFILSSLAVFATFASLDMYIHTYSLKALYVQTAHLWRSGADIGGYLWLLWAGYGVLAPLFVFIFSKGYEAGKSTLEQGMRYGFWIGLLLAAPGSIFAYVVMPIPDILAVAWFVTGLFEALVAGLVLGIVYRPKEA